MMLRDLFLLRRSRVHDAAGLDAKGPKAKGSDAALAVIDSSPALGAEPAAVLEKGAPLPILLLVSTSATAMQTAAEPDQMSAPDRPKSMVHRRITPLRLDDTVEAEARLGAVLDRLAIVHDPNEVLLTGKDRSAQIVMANRRLMAARFCVEGKDDRTFVFRMDEAPEPAVAAIAAALVDFCADPVGLVITEQPVRGVFAAVGGLSVEALHRCPTLPEPGPVRTA